MMECQRWNQFLKEVLPNQVDRINLQKFFGYCFLEDTRFEKAVVIAGPGLGKSTLADMLIEVVGHEKTVAIPLSMLDHQFYLARLEGARLNVISDLEPGQLTDICSHGIKALISGDIITASRMHENPFDFKPFAKLAFVSNFIPPGSIFEGRRFLVLKVEQQPITPDPQLFEKLLQELPAIVAWVREGLEMLLADEGFTL